MSTLDGAFIKAYRKGVAVAPANPAPQVVAAPSWIVHSAREAPMHAPPHAVIQPPHVHFAPASNAPVVVATAQTMPEALPARHPAASEPAFEVSRFIWPAMVGQLVSAAGSQFSNLIGLLASRGRQSRKVLIATGHQRGEGRTTLVLALAHVAATRAMRVVVVDADFANPQLADLLGIVPQLGLAEILESDQPVMEALVESTSERISLFPLTGRVEDTSHLVHSRRFPETIDTLREHYDLVLVDAGPLGDDKLAIDLAALLAGSAIDDGLVIRDPSRTSTEGAKEVGRRLGAAGVLQWDVADNFVGTAAGTPA